METLVPTSAVEGALALLRSRLGGACWLLTRIDQSVHVCVAADGDVAPAPGEVVDWEPAPAAVRLPGGRIVGGLGPLGPARSDPELVAAVAALLGELAGGAEERTGVVSLDSVTGLPDRAGWDQLCRGEADRARRSPAPLSIVSVTVSDASAPTAMLAAHTLRATCRSVDLVARVGPTEFAVLGTTPGADPEVLLARLAAALGDEGVAATLGFARSRPGRSLATSFTEARSAAGVVVFADRR